MIVHFNLDEVHGQSLRISVLCEIIIVYSFLRVKETENTKKNERKERSNKMKVKPASDVLFNYDITASKCPWALSDCESKVWYWLVATALLPGTLKTKKSQSHNSLSCSHSHFTCKWNRNSASVATKEIEKTIWKEIMLTWGCVLKSVDKITY